MQEHVKMSDLYFLGRMCRAGSSTQYTKCSDPLMKSVGIYELDQCTALDCRIGGSRHRGKEDTLIRIYTNCFDRREYRVCNDFFWNSRIMLHRRIPTQASVTSSRWLKLVFDAL